jgi:hypothetical protein
MKSFNQFLQESYLSEEIPTGMSRDEYNRLPADSRRRLSGSDAGLGRSGQTLTPQQTPLAVRGARRPVDTSQSWSHRNSGKLPIPNPPKPQGTTTTVPGSSVRGETGNSGTSGRSPRPYSGTTSPSARFEPAGAGNSQQVPSKPAGSPSRTPADLQKTLADRRAARAAAEAEKTAKGGALALRPQSAVSSAAREAEKTAAKTATKSVGKGILRGAGRLIGPASAAIDVADERAKGSGWARSLAKGAAVAAGGALGGTAGSVAGPVGTVGGAVGGSMAASKAFDVAAGPNAKERMAIKTANRKSQAGGAIKGIGGKTTFDTKKNTITTGTGAQRKTAQLGKTSVVTDPKTGKQDTGYLAYKGGKAVYKRAAAAGSDDGIFARIRRAVDPSGAKQSDAANAAKKLATARQSDAARNKALGVKFGPGK